MVDSGRVSGIHAFGRVFDIGLLAEFPHKSKVFK